MANVKISELPAASLPLTGAELVPITQTGATKKVTVGNLISGASATAPSAITPTGSPFTYQNAAALAVDVIVSGGGVSALELSRDGSTFYSTGTFYGLFSLSPGYRLRVTYVSAPTMTLVPR